MHELAIDEVLTDCVAYTEHNAPASILDKWSKEQLAFALNGMALRLRILRQAAHSNAPTAGGAK